MKATVTRLLLLLPCVLTALIAVITFFGARGLGDAPAWFGLWGDTIAASSKPYHLAVRSVDPGGAADLAGLRRDDLIDIRTNSLAERFSVFGQPLAGTPIVLRVDRAARQTEITVVPRRANLTRRWDIVLSRAGVVWISLFSGVIAWRRSHVPAMRLLYLVLVSYALWGETAARAFAAPYSWMYVVLFSCNVFGAVSIALWAACTGCFALPRSRLRRTMQTLCYVLVGTSMAIGFARIVAIVTLWFDPVALSSAVTSVPLDMACLLALACSVMAIRECCVPDRQRAVWLLAPPAFLFFSRYAVEAATSFLSSYAGYVALMYLYSFVFFVTPVVLTYAAVSRRLIDIGFALNRAAVFGAVSAIVIAAFIIVEWATSNWLMGVSHATSASVGMVVALGLGISMRYIHLYVDKFVDRVFFRKRHEHEAALRHFAHECAYITDCATLLERAVLEVKEHTNADRVEVLVADGVGSYMATGEGASTCISENDRGIVALRAWHKPIDLHAVRGSQLCGELAFPISSRGTLLGVLVCGVKRDGENYAPDESDALLALAHGVGSSLDTMSSRDDAATGSLREMLARILEQQNALLSKLDGRTSLPP